MTQEELNELIAGNLGELEVKAKKPANPNEGSPKAKNSSEAGNPFLDNNNGESPSDIDGYRVDSNMKWPPPPPTKSHRVVYQLDDVTKGLETKASEVFDKLESISANASLIEEGVKKLSKYFESQQNLMEKLSRQFPSIKTFQDSLTEAKEAKKHFLTIRDSAVICADSALEAMDIMQYQDIHRQKIERVVNVMRALSKYLNSILDSDVRDETRVGSASYIEGDSAKNTVSSDDIESLIESLRTTKE